VFFSVFSTIFLGFLKKICFFAKNPFIGAKKAFLPLPNQKPNLELVLSRWLSGIYWRYVPESGGCLSTKVTSITLPTENY